MKKTIVAIGALVLVIGLFTGAARAADKLAYVDLSKLFSDYPKTKAYDKTLTDKEQAYTTERDKRAGEVKAFQDKINLLSDKEKEAKRPELESKIRELQEFDRQKQTDLRKEQDERMKEIMKDIEEAVKQCAVKDGYTLVFNERVLIYQAKSLDITDKVSEVLNKKK